MTQRHAPLLRRLLAIDPDDLAANRAALDAFDGAERRDAAATLAEIETEPARRSAAIRALEASTGAAILKVGSAGIVGDLVWSGPDALDLALAWDTPLGPRRGDARISHQPGHSLERALGRAARIDIPWPEAARAVRLTIAPELIRIGPPLVRPLDPRAVLPVWPLGQTPREPRALALAVIVPVYKDLEATRACFDALLADRETGPPRRIIAIDDASPEPAITALLDMHARAGRIELIRNTINLGFVGAVNTALSRLRSHEDALLLNADALPPRGALARLARSAWSASDIATVTPLSNNGELTSVPQPFVVNPLPDPAAIAALDAALAAAFPGRTVDAPNGVGFCLYIRRDALNALGGLDESLERGYLEDVEFCLRAADAGLRNVCALDVYVGHAGTLSFGRDKRRLVMRNLRAIARRWPDIRARTEAFMQADPLSTVRAHLERAALTAGLWPACDTLCVARTRIFQHRLTPRLALLGADPQQTLLVALPEPADASHARLQAPNGGYPQDFTMSVEPGSGADIIARRLVQNGLTRIVIADAAAVTPDMAHFLARLPGLVHLDVSDAPSCAAADAWTRNSGFAPLVGRIARITAASAELARLLAGSFGSLTIETVPTPSNATVRRDRPPEAGNRSFGWGIVAAEPSPALQALLPDLVDAIRRTRPLDRIVIFGPAPPLPWLNAADAYATGPFDARDLADLFDFHDIDAAAIAAPESEAGGQAAADTAILFPAAPTLRSVSDLQAWIVAMDETA